MEKTAGTAQRGDDECVVKASIGEKRYRVTALGIPTENGLIVSVLGGEKPHVGAIALGVPRPSSKDPKVTSVTSSVLVLPGHKDDLIARPLSEKFAREFKRPAVVIAGVHVDKADDEGIAQLVSNSTKAGDRLFQILKDRQKRQ